MTGKSVLMTGATSGIGQAAAEKLASMGARIIQIARNPDRGKDALGRLIKVAPNAAHTVHYADLSSIGDTKRVAEEIAAAEPRIDVLINNAGAIYSSCQLTEEGLERTFALNHMAYFVLTLGLLHRLKSSAPARIVNTSSDAHQSASLDFDDLQSIKAYGHRDVLELLRYGGPAYKVYARSKLCNVLFTRELAKRVKGAGITVNCFHPGFVATRFADHAGGLLSFSVGIAKRFARSAEQGAETLVFLASSPTISAVTAEYFDNCHPVPPGAAAMDDAAAERLWMESSRLAGFTASSPVD